MRRRYRRREFVFASAWFRGEATVQRDAGDGQSVGHRPIEVDVSSLAQLAKTLLLKIKPGGEAIVQGQLVAALQRLAVVGAVRSANQSFSERKSR